MSSVHTHIYIYVQKLVLETRGRVKRSKQESSLGFLQKKDGCPHDFLKVFGVACEIHQSLEPTTNFYFLGCPSNLG